MSIRKEIIKHYLAIEKIKECKFRGQIALERHKKNIEIEAKRLSDDTSLLNDDPIKKQIIDNYLQSYNNMNTQLTDEQQRQLENWAKKFDIKLSVIKKKQDEAITIYSLKFKNYVTKHKALFNLVSQSDNDDSVYDCLKEAFVNESDIIESKSPVKLEEIKIQGV